MTTTTVDRSTSSDSVRTPSVLAVLVTRDASRWLRPCLQSLAAQTHPRLGVVAVDNGSTDGSLDLLRQALGEGRVIPLAENRGLAGALVAATELPPAQAADYLLVVHDDAALAPDAIARMLDAAEGIRGVERVGVVGPKIVDWDEPRILREVGSSTDRFGHPYTPLQDGERDQGQYDRVLEVLFVSSAVMLVSRDAWQRTGPFDERFAGHHDDMDFCWRARLAGFRVLMTPLATARHRDARSRGERVEEQRHRSPRYLADRASLASMLKDYGVPTLLWLLPVYAVFGAIRLVSLAISRRFEDAYDLLAALGWNVLHLPGTLRRRIRAQSVRSVADRKIKPFMASTFRLPRWFERAEVFLDEGLEELEDEDRGPLPRRAAGLAAGHPVLIGAILGIALGALAIRHFIGPEELSGGALASFPGRFGDFFDEFASGIRTTVLGGVQPGSPALAGLGALSWAAFANTALALKIALAALPAVAGIVMYRAMARETSSPGAAVIASGAYVLPALTLWAFSEGRLGSLVMAAVLPFAWDRADACFGRDASARAFRSSIGFGVALAIGITFEPSIVLPVGLFVAANLVAGRRRGRGLALVAAATAAALLLAFPVVLGAAGRPADALTSAIGIPDAWALLRLSPGAAPANGVVAAFLPIAAAICFAGVREPHRGRAWRALLVAVAGTLLSWASVAGLLPIALTNAPAWLAAAAVGEVVLIALGLASMTRDLGRQAFGARQLGLAVVTVVLALGIAAQALQVVFADWAVRPGGLPPAWPVVASSPGSFRILWLATPDGDRFPAPGGDPIGVADARGATVAFGLTDRDGASALDHGRARSGAGYDELRDAVVELVGGDTQHAGALLGPFGVRFIVADQGSLSPAALERIDLQLDLDRVPAGGLTIWRNAAALPLAFVSPDAPVPDRSDPAAVEATGEVTADQLAGAGQRYAGVATTDGHAVVTEQFDGGWRVDNDGEPRSPFEGYGWAIAAPVREGEVAVGFADQWIRDVQLGVLTLLWLAALWITRRPASA